VTQLLPLSVGIGLAVGLLFTELFGVGVGGLIVPGYLALYLSRPLDVLVTIGAGLVTFAVVRTLSSLVILYGRRRTVAMILVGYLVGMAVRWASGTQAFGDHELVMVGFVIPGLIAIWLDRQGIPETLSALLTASVLVRLILVVVTGGEVGP
jgi:poly-gamma-glutamate biosynthesis protein PgsC/CapC